MTHVYTQIDFYDAVHLMKNEFELFSFKERYKKDYQENSEKTIDLFKKNMEQSSGTEDTETNTQFFEKLLTNKIPVLTHELFNIKYDHTKKENIELEELIRTLIKVINGQEDISSELFQVETLDNRTIIRIENYIKHEQSGETKNIRIEFAKST